MRKERPGDRAAIAVRQQRFVQRVRAWNVAEHTDDLRQQRDVRQPKHVVWYAGEVGSESIELLPSLLSVSEVCIKICEHAVNTADLAAFINEGLEYGQELVESSLLP